MQRCQKAELAVWGGQTWGWISLILLSATLTWCIHGPYLKSVCLFSHTVITFPCWGVAGTSNRPGFGGEGWVYWVMFSSCLSLETLTSPPAIHSSYETILAMICSHALKCCALPCLCPSHHCPMFRFSPSWVALQVYLAWISLGCAGLPCLPLHALKWDWC